MTRKNAVLEVQIFNKSVRRRKNAQRNECFFLLFLYTKTVLDTITPKMLWGTSVHCHKSAISYYPQYRALFFIPPPSFLVFLHASSE